MSKSERILQAARDRARDGSIDKCQGKNTPNGRFAENNRENRRNPRNS